MTDHPELRSDDEKFAHARDELLKRTGAIEQMVEEFNASSQWWDARYVPDQYPPWSGLHATWRHNQGVYREDMIHELSQLVANIAERFNLDPKYITGTYMDGVWYMVKPKFRKTVMQPMRD